MPQSWCMHQKVCVWITNVVLTKMQSKVVWRFLIVLCVYSFTIQTQWSITSIYCQFGVWTTYIIYELIGWNGGNTFGLIYISPWIHSTMSRAEKLTSINYSIRHDLMQVVCSYNGMPEMKYFLKQIRTLTEIQKGNWLQCMLQMDNFGLMLIDT